MNSSARGRAGSYRRDDRVASAGKGRSVRVPRRCSVGRLTGEDCQLVPYEAEQEAIHGNVSLHAQEKAAGDPIVPTKQSPHFSARRKIIGWPSSAPLRPQRSCSCLFCQIPRRGQSHDGQISQSNTNSAARLRDLIRPVQPRPPSGKLYYSRTSDSPRMYQHEARPDVPRPRNTQPNPKVSPGLPLGSSGRVPRMVAPSLRQSPCRSRVVEPKDIDAAPVKCFDQVARPTADVNNTDRPECQADPGGDCQHTGLFGLQPVRNMIEPKSLTQKLLAVGARACFTASGMARRL
jgi:hypothetical protein